MQSSSNVMQAQMMEARDRVIVSVSGDRVGPFSNWRKRAPQLAVCA